MTGQYDPQIVAAVVRSNQIDDMNPDDFVRQLSRLDPSYVDDGRGRTHGDNVAAHSFAR